MAKINLHSKLVKSEKGDFRSYWTKVKANGEEVSIKVVFAKGIDTSKIGYGVLYTTDYVMPKFTEAFVGKEGRKVYPRILINSFKKFEPAKAVKSEIKYEFVDEEESTDPYVVDNELEDSPF